MTSSRHRITFFLVLVLGLLVATSAQARRVEPVQNIENSPIPAGLTMDQIRRAITAAGAIRGWVVTEMEPGHLRGQLHLRSHMALVDINFDTNTYSIVYNSSDNLKYKNGNIHRNYNSWVRNLNGDIQVTLNAMAQ